jgi:predicted RNase H-like HicB family nuclease
MRRKSKKELTRPFKPETLRRARQIAESYQIIVHREDGEYYGRSPQLPNAMNDGKIPAKCIAATRAILTTAVAWMIENGQTPPFAASGEHRAARRRR